MELKPGYKQTEIGMIPEDWELSTLFDISKKITDGEHSTPTRTSNGYYLLSARNILDGRIDLSDVDYVGADEYRRIRQRCNPEPGDILISCSGTLGRVAIVPDGLECVMVRSAALVKPNFTKVNAHYVQYFLQSAAGQNQISVSLNQGAQANLFLNHIQGLRISLPSTKAEQEAIAEGLIDMDALISALEKLITKKRDLKLAAMQQLLTGKRRLPGFNVDWEVKRLGEIAQLYQPVTISADIFTSNGYPVYGANGVVGFYSDFNHDTWQVTVTCRGSTCGTVNRAVDRCWITGNAMVVNCDDNKEMDKTFLYYLLASHACSFQRTGKLLTSLNPPRTKSTTEL
jgi:type I restriction enzyme S subunit